MCVTDPDIFVMLFLYRNVTDRVTWVIFWEVKISPQKHRIKIHFYSATTTEGPNQISITDLKEEVF